MPIQTIRELLSVSDNELVEARLMALAEEYPVRRMVTPEDRDFKTYVEFGELIARITGASDADQQSIREFIDSCTDHPGE